MPNHIYDWIVDNWRTIQADFISINKLIAQKGWTEVTAQQISILMYELRTEFRG